MKVITKVSFIAIIILVLSLASCSSPERLVRVDIYDWDITPSDTIKVGEEADIMLKIGVSLEYGYYVLYHWIIDDYDREIITDANALTGITFTTPGTKKVLVYVISNCKDFKTNTFSRNITVLPNE